MTKYNDDNDLFVSITKDSDSEVKPQKKDLKEKIEESQNEFENIHYIKKIAVIRKIGDVKKCN